jgi:hypothetical protein
MGATICANHDNLCHLRAKNQPIFHHSSTKNPFYPSKITPPAKKIQKKSTFLLPCVSTHSEDRNKKTNTLKRFFTSFVL